MIGERLAHFRVMQKLGEGGMGVVYRAHDESLERDVALKVLPASTFRDATARARLLREARSAAALNHPNICTVYEVGEFEDKAYIAMELVEGRPLSARVAEGAIPQDEAARYGLQIADALAHAHERGIIHRDLKSPNIVIAADGRAKVLDFGLAKRATTPPIVDAAAPEAGETVTQTGVLIGTIGYMAPEQLRGEPADVRSDIWALGVVLFEMLAGVRPFSGAMGYGILHSPPGHLPDDVRPELRAVVMRCLEKDPARRYQRASEVRTGLEVVQSGIEGLPVAPHQFARRWLLATPLAAVLVISGLLALDAGGLRTRLLGGKPRQVESVAVLPLENLSRDADQDYVADGIQDALITDLARLGGFKKVIARASVARYRKTDKPLRKIGQELGVQAVLLGAVMRSGDRIRVTAQLVRADSEENLWAERYDRQFKDVLELQNEIVTAIARGIKNRLTPEQQAQLARRRSVDPEAHEAYLRGIFFVNKLTPESIQKGLASLQLAVAKDPGNALPYAGLARGYSIIGHTPNAPPGTLAKAKAAALKALEIDPDNAEAQEALTEVKVYDDKDWDWAVIEKMFKRTLEVNPSLPQAHAHYGWYLDLFGRYEEGMAEIRKAAELDPLNPLYASWVTQQYTFVTGPNSSPAGFDKAIEQANKTLEIGPNSPAGLADLGTVYLAKGMAQQAVPYLEKARKLNPDFGWELGIAYAMLKQPEKALQLVTELQGPGISWNRWGIAHIYAALGDRDKAFEWLEKAYEFRHPYIPWMRVSAPLQPLKSDSRFQEMVRRMKLPPVV